MECPVCFEHKNRFVWFACAHNVCVDCSARMVEFNHTECPLCRGQIKAPIPERVQDPRQEPEQRIVCTDQIQLMVCAFGGLGLLLTCLGTTFTQQF